MRIYAVYGVYKRVTPISVQIVYVGCQNPNSKKVELLNVYIVDVAVARVKKKTTTTTTNINYKPKHCTVLLFRQNLIRLLDDKFLIFLRSVFSNPKVREKEDDEEKHLT